MSDKNWITNLVVPKASVQMEVTQPKLAIGLRGPILPEGESTLRQELALRLFFAMILGWTSRCYQELYENGQIDDSFDFEIEVYQKFPIFDYFSRYVSADCYGNKFATIFKQSSNV